MDNITKAYKKYEEKQKKDNIEWYALYEEKEKRIINEINQCLQDKHSRSYDKIVEIFDEDTIKIYESRTIMAYVMSAVNIYFSEKKAGRESVIFDCVDSVSELIDVINGVRFYIWRIIFQENAQAKEDLIEYAKQYKLSPEAISYIKMMAIPQRENIQEKEDVDLDVKKPSNDSEGKIAFIMCVNDAMYEQEAMNYINNLIVPEGYEIEVYSIYDAKSMCSGYNEGMSVTDAKYKIYMHQDCFIIDEYFLFRILKTFANSEIGMLGMVGSPKLPDNNIMWYGERVGEIYRSYIYATEEFCLGKIQGEYNEVEAVDGLLIATQYDIPWREDVFDKWDFYDVSQSAEFRNAGYKVVVPYMQVPMCLHDDGFMDLKNYYGERDKFEQKYKSSINKLANEKIVNENDRHPITIVISSNGDAKRLSICLKFINMYARNEETQVLVISDVHMGLEDLFSDVEFVLNDKGQNAYNLGIKNAHKGNDIIFTDENSVFLKGTVEMLQRDIYTADNAGIAACVYNCGSKEQYVDKEIENFEQAQSYAEANNIFSGISYEYKCWLSKDILYVKNEVLNKVREFDEEYEKGLLAGEDYCLKALQYGYKSILCHNSFIYRIISEISENIQLLYNHNVDRFAKQRGIKPVYYSNVREDLIPLIDEHKDSVFNVLEVGCGTGATLGRIKYMYPNSNIYGMEIMPKVAEIGSRIFNIECGNIEEADLKYEKKYFDYIIFGDVIEHLLWPETVLKKLTEYLKPNGKIIASIPNMMNASVIYDLLRGKFTYEDSGIRDRTHFRFFTYEEIINMFIRCGYSIKDTRMRKSAGYTTKDFGEFYDKLLAIEGVADRQLFDAFQYIIVAENNHI